MRKICLGMVGLTLCTLSVMAQSRKVTGRVVSKEDGEPIIGASIIAKGTSIGTVTDFDGNFTLDVPNEAGTLVISYIGMATQNVKVQPLMNISMESDTQDLDEVVVTGYGVTKKAAFTGSAQVVNNEVLTQKTDANFMKSLEGSVTGLQVNSASGQPGAFATTTIRGKSSINSGTEPLYVIDGVPIFTNKVGSWSGQEVSPMANINPADIESVTVLKDATATSIYGARAANGVIVISTKRGKSGRARFTFDAKAGFSQASHLDREYRMVDLDKYKEIWSEGYVNAGLATTKEEGYEMLRQNGIDWYGFDMNETPSVDWLDEILRTGVTQEYNLSVQGGTETGRYFANLGYFENQGTMIGSGMKRYSGRLNLDGNRDRIGYGLSVNMALSDIDNIPISSDYTNPMVVVYDSRPFQQVYNPDGSYAMVQEGFYNPVAMYDKESGDEYNQKTLTAIINPYFTYKIMEGLTWKTNAGLSLMDIREFWYNGMNNPESWSSTGCTEISGSRYNYRTTNYTLTNTLNWIKTFQEKHNLNLMLGQEVQKQTFSKVSAEAKGYPQSDLRELDNASTPVTAGSLYKASTLSSFFFNGEYNYNNKYYGSASFRYDGSSRFGENNKWAPFWSVGGKYRISEEEYMADTKDWLNDLTLRASYGTVGNQDIGEYAAMGLYSYGYGYNSQPGAKPSQIANPDLKWETVAKFDIGVNASLFNLLSVELDYYNQRTKDMIFEVPTSYTTGFDYVTKNVGEMENRGIEAMVNATLIRTQDFTWSATASFTYNRNEIKSLATDEPITTTYSIQQAGHPINSHYLKEYAGVDPQTGKALFYTDGKGSPTTDNPNEAKQVILGQMAPKYFGAFSMNFRYRDFDLSASLNYSAGNKVYNRGMEFDLMCGDYELGPVATYVYENRWQKPGDVTDVPQFIAGGQGEAAARSSRFLMNAAYARMKNITLGYTLPKKIAKALTIDNLRVYASVDNLFTITAKDFIGFDPQAEDDYYQQWTYPVPTTYLFGVNLSF